MKRMIIIVLLVCQTFSGIAYASSVPWTCSSCGNTYYFDPGDDAHRRSWTANHYSVCSGGGEIGYQEPVRRISFEGAILVGAFAGGTLAIGYAYAYNQPEMLAIAGAGAFFGSLMMAMVWMAGNPSGDQGP